MYNFSVLLLSFFLTAVPPTVNRHPKKQSVATGANVYFSIEATGSDLQFQWKKEGNNLSDDDKYCGTNTDILRILKVQESDQGHYNCLVRNDAGEKLSYEAFLTTHSKLGNVCGNLEMTSMHGA